MRVSVVQPRGGCRIFERGGGVQPIGLHAKRGPALGSMLKSLHCGPKGGGGVQTPPSPPGSAPAAWP